MMSPLHPAVFPERDHVDGADFARFTLVVFGAFGVPDSAPLGTVLADLRERHGWQLRTVWRHCPGTPRSALLALATEAAALHGRFWVLTRELLRLRHFEAEDVHVAMVRARLDPPRTWRTAENGQASVRL